MIDRRQFLFRTGMLLASTAIPSSVTTPASAVSPQSWEDVRRQFNLAAGVINMTTFYLASHPLRVRQTIDRHRRGLDANAFEYINQQGPVHERSTLLAASEYLAVNPADIALTDSTTMGLGLLYGGLRLKAGQEILTSVHDHYATDISLRLRAARTGTRIRKVTLYSDPARASESEILQALRGGITPQTRLIALTWVHSVSGVKLPVTQISALVSQVNRTRTLENKIYFSIDGVHGIGIEDVTLPQLGCDFFVAGTHKWLFGPRGTGLVWATDEAWTLANAIIPTFDRNAYGQWMGAQPVNDIEAGALMTPGGFHSFEHRWALGEAFRFHQEIGKSAVMSRVHQLNTQLKQGLNAMRQVRLRTPMSPALSSGITCFEVENRRPDEVVERLRQRRIVASVTPYSTRYVRIAPGILNSPEEVSTVLQEIRNL